MTVKTDVLRKMIALATAVESPVFAAADKVMAQALGKAARARYDIEAVLNDVQTGQSGLLDLLGTAPQPGLLMVIDTAHGDKGVAWFDPQLVNAVIELETGAPDDSVLLGARQPTRIDAALSREFLLPVLAEFANESNRQADEAILPDLRVGRHETDPQQLVYALETGIYGWVSGNFRFQDDIRGGGFMLALPMAVWAQGGGARPSAIDPVWHRSLAENLLSAPYRLDAVLDVIDMPLSRAMTLQVGDVLAVSGAALSDLKLMTLNGKVALHGRLGQMRAKKAVSITGSPLLDAANHPAVVPPMLTQAAAQTDTPLPDN